MMILKKIIDVYVLALFDQGYVLSTEFNEYAKVVFLIFHKHDMPILMDFFYVIRKPNTSMINVTVIKWLIKKTFGCLDIKICIIIPW